MNFNKNSKNIIEKDLVLLGAGHSNIEVLNQLGKKAIKGVRVTIINNRYEATYSGMIPSYIEGNYDWKDINIDLPQLCSNYNHRLIISTINKIDIIEKKIIFKDRCPLEYDVLSINLGIKSDDKKIIGASKFALKLKPISNIKQNIEKILEFNLKNPNNDIVLIGAGAAGVEVSLSLSSLFKKKNIMNKIILISKNSDILKNYTSLGAKTIKKELLKEKIKVYYNSEVTKITKNYLILNNKKKINCKWPILSTSSSPLELLDKSNLPRSANGDILTNNFLLVKGTENVFASGDIAQIAEEKIPKAGVYAVKQGNILYKNIKRLFLKKKLIKYYPQKNYLSLIGLPNKKAVAIKSFIFFKSSLFWYLKRYIDKKFVQKYSYNNKYIGKINNSVEPYKNKMQCKGCGNKIPQLVLDKVFKENISKGSLDADKVFKTKNLYHTTDIISSIVSDPYKLGIISANHSLNDIMASLAEPLSAQMIVSMPPALNKINARDLEQIHNGSKKIMKMLRCKISGGHTYSSNDDQIYLGFSIIGRKKNNHKNNISKGNVYITGKIGSSLVFAGVNNKVVNGIRIKEVIDSMTSSNFDLFKILYKNNVKIVTDISGFGLAIHAYNLILRFPKLKGMKIYIDKIPLYRGAEIALSKNIQSSLASSNKEYIKKKLKIECNKKKIDLIFDPQTAGGMLFILDKNNEKILNELNDANIKYTLIGKTISSNGKLEII